MAQWEDLHKSITVSEPHEKVVEWAKELKPSMRILDMGCGKGRHSIYLAKKGCEVHALDIAESGLKDLRKSVEGDQLFERVKVVKADMREMPFPEEYFDAIITVNVINHGYWKDLQAFFNEATRVLKSKGRFYIIGLPVDFIEESKTPETKEVEPRTFLGLDTPDGDYPHHALNDKEIDELLKDYDILKKEVFKEYSKWVNREVTHIEIIAEKK
jgi:cyclopropane fatty-acyl-phospholipid synthase-like methyltransferase